MAHFYIISYRVNPICGIRKRIVLPADDYIDDYLAMKKFKQLSNDNLNPILRYE